MAAFQVASPVQVPPPVLELELKAEELERAELELKAMLEELRAEELETIKELELRRMLEELRMEEEDARLELLSTPPQAAPLVQIFVKTSGLLPWVHQALRVYL